MNAYFATPDWLLGLLVIPWVLLLWHRRSAPALAHPLAELLRTLPRGRARRILFGKAIGRSLVLASLIVAAAGPRTPDLQTRIPVEGIAIVLVVDTSGSMASADFPASADGSSIPRIQAAQQALQLFVAGGVSDEGLTLDGRGNDEIGLVTFAAVPEPSCPLTLDHATIVSRLQELKPRASIDAGTNIGDALVSGVLLLEHATDRRKVMIVLSDGEHNVTREGPNAPLPPFAAAQLARSLGVTIYTIDCGGPPDRQDTPEAQLQRADGRRVLEGIAQLTQGQAFTANSGADLQAVYRAIDQFERQPVETYLYRRYHDHTALVAGLALALFTLIVILERTRWAIIP